MATGATLASEALTRAPARAAAAAGAALAITLGLFWLMQSLIATARGRVDEAARQQVVDFVRLKRSETLQTKDRKPEKPPEPNQAPKAPDLDPQAQGPSSQSGIQIGAIAPDVSIERGLAISVSEGDYLPIVKVAPMYPLRAQQRGLEGWVMLEFTVTKAGTVRDPVVIDAKPAGVFDRAAMSAALKFKYKPRVVNGQPIEVPGVRHRIVFELED